jgi:MYXO-CTERM domain-containing protein
VKPRTGGRLVDVVGEDRRVPEPSPPPWLAGAAALAMAGVAATRTRRSLDFDDHDLPGGT